MTCRRKLVAGSGKPVLLKRGLSATVEEWLYAAEYLAAGGCSRIVLCERGIRTFETATRNTLDVSSIPVLRDRSHLPVIADPSHAAGRREWVGALSKAAVAAGADGLVIVNADPYLYPMVMATVIFLAVLLDSLRSVATFARS